MNGTRVISLVAALAQNRVIGGSGNLLWHIPEDLRHFKELTRGKTVLMGRKTWESLPPQFRPLPERRNLVMTRNADFRVDVLAQGAEVFASLPEALSSVPEGEVCVIGGGEIYAQAMPMANALHLTHIEAEFAGDTFFPEITEDWQEVARATKIDERSGLTLHFVSYAKKGTRK